MKFIAGIAFTVLCEMFAFVIIRTDWHATVPPEIGLPWGAGFLFILILIVGSGVAGIFGKENT